MRNSNLVLLHKNYKFLARIYARRVETALRSVVGRHLKCGFRGRSININLHRMQTACGVAESCIHPLAVLKVQLRKAFCQVAHACLFVLFSQFKLGDEMAE